MFTNHNMPFSTRQHYTIKHTAHTFIIFPKKSQEIYFNIFNTTVFMNTVLAMLKGKTSQYFVPEGFSVPLPKC